MTAATFDHAAAAIAKLDLSSEVKAVSQLLAESAKIAEAIERANTRLGEIGYILNTRSDSEAGWEVANALLDGAAPAEAAALATASREALLIERANLSAGMSDLRRRDNAIAVEMRELQDKARARLAEPLQPLIAAVMADAQAAAENIANAYAILEGLSIATRHATGEAGKLGKAVARMWGLDLIEYRPRLEVPEGVSELLAPVEKIGEALPVHVPSWVGMPDDIRNVSMIATQEARRAVG